MEEIVLGVRYLAHHPVHDYRSILDNATVSSCEALTSEAHPEHRQFRVLQNVCTHSEIIRIFGIAGSWREYDVIAVDSFA
jgi:hypothetical protein